MRKFVYIPRKKQGGSFNVEIEPGAGSYLYSILAPMGTDMVGGNRIMRPLQGDGSQDAAGYINYTGFNTIAGRVIVNTALEVFLSPFNMEQVFNKAANGQNFSVWAETGATPFKKVFSSPTYTDTLLQTYKPEVGHVGRQNVYVTFKDLTYNGNNENILVCVNKNHFSSSYSDHFFTSGQIGGGLSSGTYYINNMFLNSWRNLFNEVDNGLKQYFNTTDSFMYNASETLHCKVYFPSCLSNTDFNDVNGVNYRFTQSPQTPEGVGINTQQFNAVINV